MFPEAGLKIYDVLEACDQLFLEVFESINISVALRDYQALIDKCYPDPQEVFLQPNITNFFNLFINFGLKKSGTRLASLKNVFVLLIQISFLFHENSILKGILHLFLPCQGSFFL